MNFWHQPVTPDHVRQSCSAQGHSQYYCSCTAVADTCVVFYFLKRFLVVETQTHTHTTTHRLIAVCCLSSWLALWKGHLTKPLTRRCNTCVCSDLSDTKKDIYGHCHDGRSSQTCDWLDWRLAGWLKDEVRHQHHWGRCWKTRTRACAGAKEDSCFCRLSDWQRGICQDAVVVVLVPV